MDARELIPTTRRTVSFLDPLSGSNKKAQLSLTNPRDACEKFARFTLEQWGGKLYR